MRRVVLPVLFALGLTITPQAVFAELRPLPSREEADKDGRLIPTWVMVSFGVPEVLALSNINGDQFDLLLVQSQGKEPGSKLTEGEILTRTIGSDWDEQTKMAVLVAWVKHLPVKVSRTMTYRDEYMDAQKRYVAKMVKDTGLLFLCLERGNLKVADFLISHGADINDKNSLDNTLTHKAITWGDPKTVAWALEKNLPLDLQNHMNRTPLGEATVRLRLNSIGQPDYPGQKEIVELVLAKIFNVPSLNWLEKNIGNKAGWRVLSKWNKKTNRFGPIMWGLVSTGHYKLAACAFFRGIDPNMFGYYNSGYPLDLAYKQYQSSKNKTLKRFIRFCAYTLPTAKANSYTIDAIKAEFTAPIVSKINVEAPVKYINKYKCQAHW